MSEPVARDLRWDGCHNVRDLGGMPTEDGLVTRTGALVRADELCVLSPIGCAELRAHGLRTVLDLLDARSGAAAYLRSGGLSDAALERLRRRLVAERS